MRLRLFRGRLDDAMAPPSRHVKINNVDEVLNADLQDRSPTAGRGAEGVIFCLLWLHKKRRICPEKGGR